MNKRVFRREIVSVASYIAIPMIFVAPTLVVALLIHVRNLPGEQDPSRRLSDMVPAVLFAAEMGVGVDAISCDGRGNCTVRTTDNAWLGLRCPGRDEPCFLAWAASVAPTKRSGEQ